MTSTNIFTGMAGNRNSSRVLRPPGGGHTDILGLSSEPEAPQTKKSNPRNVSSIVEGTNTNSHPGLPLEHPVSQEAEKTLGFVNGQSTSKNEPILKSESISAVPSSVNPAPRARVPPGGFSSGLW